MCLPKKNNKNDVLASNCTDCLMIESEADIKPIHYKSVLIDIKHVNK